MWTNRIR